MGLPAIVVVVAGSDPTAAIAASASMMPAPQYLGKSARSTTAMLDVQSRPVPVGNARAVDVIAARICAGVFVGATESISDTMPATCGVAMLVPW